MKIKSLALLSTAFLLTACGGESGVLETKCSWAYQAGSQTVSFSKGNSTDLDNVIGYFNGKAPAIDFVVGNMVEGLTQYMDGSSTNGLIIFSGEHGFEFDSTITGGKAKTYDANVKEESEYSSSVGLMYGIEAGVCHFYSQNGGLYSHKSYFRASRTTNSEKRSIEVLDDKFEIKDNVLTVYANGNYSYNDEVAISFSVSILFQKQ